MKIKVENLPEEAQAMVPEIVQVKGEIAKLDSQLSKLEEVLRKKWTPEKIAKLLSNMCEASDVKKDKMGNDYETPNWDARKNGFDRLTGMLRYTKKESQPVDQGATKIVFQIVNNPPAEKKSEEKVPKETD